MQAIFSLALYLGAYAIPSYFLLQKLGVRNRLVKRAFVFGTTLGILLVILPLSLMLFGVDLISILGAFLGPVLGYWYVQRVLVVKWYINVAVVVCMPLVAGLFASPLLYLYFKSVA